MQTPSLVILLESDLGFRFDYCTVTSDTDTFYSWDMPEMQYGDFRGWCKARDISLRAGMLSTVVFEYDGAWGVASFGINTVSLSIIPGDLTDGMRSQYKLDVEI